MINEEWCKNKIGTFSFIRTVFSFINLNIAAFILMEVVL